MVNKANLILKIAELVKLKKIDGITDLRDETNREGMRIVIELRKDANANVILNQLYKHTQLQDSFGIIMLALVDGQPKVMNILDMLHFYLEHQKDVVTRRTKYDLNKEPVSVKKGDIVKYTLRIYNEGSIDGYASEITEDVPEGLEFIWSEKTENELEADTTLTQQEKEAIRYNQLIWNFGEINKDTNKVETVTRRS